MTDLEFTFELAPWEQALQAIQPGETVTAATFLTLLEGEDELAAQNAAELLLERQISLDISDLPKLPAQGQTGTRLSLERKLVECGGLPGGLEENDPLRLYLEEVADTPATGDPRLLAQRYVEGDESVVPQLAALKLGRVIELAKLWVDKGVMLLDLIQEGSLGLWQGALCYTGGDIDDHCDWWIRQFMAVEITLQARAAGVGFKLKQAMEDYRDVDQRLLAELGRNPTPQEIAESLHISPEAAQTLESMLQNARTVQRARGEEPVRQEEEEDQAVENTAYFQTRQRIQEMLSTLTPEESELLTLRFGLEGGTALSHEQAAQRLGITPEEAVARETAALMKLRQQKED